MSYQTFETERLFIRPTTEEDAEFIFELLNTPKWIQHIGDRNIRSVESARQYIKNRMLPQLERLGFANYTLIRKADGQKIGTCGLYEREGLEGVDIGFALLPAYEKQGYAYESADRLLRAGFEEFGLTTVSGITTKENLASQQLLTKLGLTLQGTTRIPNDEAVLLLYSREK